MTTEVLKQGQHLSSVTTPNYDGSDEHHFSAGQRGCKTITVCHLAGPMGFYDCAHITFSNGLDDMIIPLHQCETIEFSSGTSDG